MNARQPAQVLPPGEFLKDELEARGWSQVELAEILARPPRLICEIIAGKRAITPETAKGLEAALGSSAETWMNLETAYQLSKARIETVKVSRRARLYDTFPVKEVLRRGWVSATTDLARLETQFCQFFEVGSLDEQPSFPHAAKKTSYDTAPMKLQLAWLLRARQIAKEVGAPAFDSSALTQALDQLKGCLKNLTDVTQACQLLIGAGVRLVVVEYLPGAKLDGACFWINDGRSPVIALSLRLDRIDNFWHTLFHEVDHILHNEGKDAPIVDLLDAQASARTDLPDFERRANRNAADYCINANAMETWVARASKVSSRASILAFAKQMSVHPGLVVGQLQHRHLIPYSYHREFLEKVRSLVVTSVPTDGYRKA